jgi:hypothetical protein
VTKRTRTIGGQERGDDSHHHPTHPGDRRYRDDERRPGHADAKHQRKRQRSGPPSTGRDRTVPEQVTSDDVGPSDQLGQHA